MGLWNTFSQYFTSIPQISEAIEFYRVHILKGNSQLAPLCDKYNFKSHIPSWKWEMFAAILVSDIAKDGNGSDLLRHEVKSAKKGSSFEYQYHCNSWHEKLANEYLIEHIYVSYEPGYRNITVRKIPGFELAPILDKWKTCIEDAYSGKPSQRCRKSITYSFVESKASLILEIENGKLKFFDKDYFITARDVSSEQIKAF